MEKKDVEFEFFNPSAKKVSVAGTFNGWDPKSLSAKKSRDGNWTAKVNLAPGKYEYKFVVDGNWLNDTRCASCVPNGVGSTNCVLVVK